MIINEEDRKITAYHEAGHTLVGKKLKDLDPIHKVTIIPRGMALGVTQTLPEEESLSLKKSKAKSMIAFLFGGRAAEEIIFEDFTTGAGNDIERATDLARKMVCEWGMSEKIGPLALERNEGPVFLGMQQYSHKEYSDFKAQEIDEEIKRLVIEGHDQAVKLLKDNQKVLENLAQALLQYETIDGEEVRILVEGGTLADIESKRSLAEEKLAKEQKLAAKEAKDKEEKEKKDKRTDDGGRDPMGSPGPITA